jgi:carbon storage regulator
MMMTLQTKGDSKMPRQTMLVVTRTCRSTCGGSHPEHSYIQIGDDIRVELMSNRGCLSKIAIRAPEDVPVHRGEVYEKLLAERERQQKAASPGSLDAAPPNIL